MLQIEIVNKAILTSIFLLGFLLGSVLVVIISELKKGDKR